MLIVTYEVPNILIKLEENNLTYRTSQKDCGENPQSNEPNKVVYVAKETEMDSNSAENLRTNIEASGFFNLKLAYGVDENKKHAIYQNFCKNFG